MIEGSKYNVFPLDDRKIERVDPAVSRRPDISAGRTEMTLYPGMSHLNENTVPNVKNRSHTVTAEIELTKDDANGVIIAQGGRFAGWVLYLEGGIPSYGYNWIDMERYFIKGEKPLGVGHHTLRFEFQYDGGGIGKGGTGLLFVDDEPVGEGRFDKTCGYMFATSDLLDIGYDQGAPVVEGYKTKHGIFEGKINYVRINVDPQHHHDVEGIAQAILSRQ